MTDELLRETNSRLNQLRRISRREQPAMDPLQGQGYVLYHLCHRGGSALPGELCRELNMTTPRMASILTVLERQGFIRRALSSADRRKVIVTVTEQGHALVQAHDEAQLSALRDVLGALGEEDAQAFCRIVGKVLAFKGRQAKNPDILRKI